MVVRLVALPSKDATRRTTSRASSARRVVKLALASLRRSGSRKVIDTVLRGRPIRACCALPGDAREHAKARAGSDQRGCSTLEATARAIAGIVRDRDVGQQEAAASVAAVVVAAGRANRSGQG
jgi:hypothetical protein